MFGTELTRCPPWQTGASVRPRDYPPARRGGLAGAAKTRKSAGDPPAIMADAAADRGYQNSETPKESVIEFL